MNPYLIYGIIGVLVMLVLYLVISPYKANVSRNLDTKTMDQNRKAREDVKTLEKIIADKKSEENILEQNMIRLQRDFETDRNILVNRLLAKEKELTVNLVGTAQKQAEDSIRLIGLQLDETILAFAREKQLKTEELEQLKEQTDKHMEDLRSLEAAAIAARMRDYEDVNQETFYCIQLDERDLLEINEILSVVEMFRNTQPIRKAVFDIYYRKPLKDLTQRVTLGNRISGVYKITHLESGKCYIGQSVDIANRWLQHCKRGFGVDAVTNNKLYPEMYREGIHNFKYEIVEEVEKEMLSEREKYWSNYFGAKVFGYTMKA
jgi:predicted GIY-YIG superfamily endonuclease